MESRQAELQTELQSMIATLHSYEEWFGPHHPNTLHLITVVGISLSHIGQFRYAQPLLERAVREMAVHIGPESESRARALEALRELLLEQHDYLRASTVQEELLRCNTIRLGSDHPETRAGERAFADLILNRLDCTRMAKI